MGMIKIVVRPQDILEAAPFFSGGLRCRNCPVAIAARRALKGVVSDVYVSRKCIQGWIGGTRILLAQLPRQASDSISVWDQTGKMTPFSFEVFVREGGDDDPGMLSSREEGK